MKKSMFRAVLFLFPAAVVLCACGAAQEEDFSGGILDRAAAPGVGRSDDDETVPGRRGSPGRRNRAFVTEADATYVQWHEEYVKILTEEGRRAYRTLSSYFTIPYQRGPEDCRMPLVEIIKPDGRVVADRRRGAEPRDDRSRLHVRQHLQPERQDHPGQRAGPGGRRRAAFRHVRPRSCSRAWPDTWSDWIMLRERAADRAAGRRDPCAPATMPLRSIA